MGTHMKTTIDIGDALFEEAQRLAARERTTLRALVEAGLRGVLAKHSHREIFVLRDGSVEGAGMSPEFSDAGWERIRDAAYGT